jgi:hypothetical protein
MNIRDLMALSAAVLGFVSVNAALAKDHDDCAGKEKLVRQHIEIFDDLDFNVFTNQKWDELKKSHSKDVIVHWPDGHVTKGIEKHIEDLKGMFLAVPDTRISAHPVKIGEDMWTSVIGVLEGTFTKPMNMGSQVIPPTGNKINMQMVTVGHWTDEGVMDEEYLFWDNATYMKQLGLAK